MPVEMAGGGPLVASGEVTSCTGCALTIATAELSAISGSIADLVVVATDGNGVASTGVAIGCTGFGTTTAMVVVSTPVGSSLEVVVVNAVVSLAGAGEDINGVATSCFEHVIIFAMGAASGRLGIIFAAVENTAVVALAGAGVVSVGVATLCTVCAATIGKDVAFEISGVTLVGDDCSARSGLESGVRATAASMARAGVGVVTNGVVTGFTAAKSCIVGVQCALVGSGYDTVTMAATGGSGESTNGVPESGTGKVIGCIGSKLCFATGHFTEITLATGVLSSTSGERFGTAGSASATAFMVSTNGAMAVTSGDGSSTSGVATGCTG